MYFKLWSSEGWAFVWHCTVRVVFSVFILLHSTSLRDSFLVSHSVQQPKVKTVNRKHWKATVCVMVPLNSTWHTAMLTPWEDLPCLFVMLRVQERTWKHLFDCCMIQKIRSQQSVSQRVREKSVLDFSLLSARVFMFTFDCLVRKIKSPSGGLRSSNIWHFSQTFYSGLSQRCHCEDVRHFFSMSSLPNCCNWGWTHNMFGGL